jgi:hypothetical protein
VSLADEKFPLRQIARRSKYYGVTLGADEDGGIWSGGFTRWKGYADDEGRLEVRALAVVNAMPVAKIWKQLEQPFMVVNTPAQFVQWCLSGGNALIQKKLLEKHMPWAIEPDPCVYEPGMGFASAADIPSNAFKRAPTPKLRMAVMKRDRYRCVLCGRNASDNVDVELHVHHIRPFGQRGLTIERNLLTLCHTCHKGLDPHYEWSLHGLIGHRSKDTAGQSPNEARRDEYLRSVDRYRKAIRSNLEILRNKKP